MDILAIFQRCEAPGSLALLKGGVERSELHRQVDERTLKVGKVRWHQGQSKSRKISTFEFVNRVLSRVLKLSTTRG
jgi:hypothetical protein